MTRWQYQIVNVGSFKTADRLKESLGRLGSEGWELVTVMDKSSNWLSGMEKGFVLFKRPVAEGEEPAEWATVDTGHDPAIDWV